MLHDKTGRVPGDMIYKAAKVGLPIVASVAAVLNSAFPRLRKPTCPGRVCSGTANEHLHRAERIILKVHVVNRPDIRRMPKRGDPLEAQKQLLDAVRSQVTAETVPLQEGFGRVLAKDVLRT